MKEMYIIVLLSSWAVGSWADWELQCPVTICPYPEKYATNLPHENDCTKFYKCSWGVPVLQDCPLMNPDNQKERLHYNRRLQVCDWPWQAGCKNCTEASVDDKCPPADKISDPKDGCNYIDCDGYEKHTCDKDTCFSRTCQKCVENRAGGKCGPPDEDPCKEGDRRPRGRPCDCTLYEECINGEWQIHECKNGLHYNPETKECDTPDQAGCVKVPSTIIENRY
ncbi:hypothetical protein ACS0PU_011860 [Formica fusca]